MKSMVFCNLRVVVLGAVVLTLAACAGVPMQGYTGPALPAEQTALVQTGAYTDLIACDGKKVSGLGLTVLPSVHTIELKPDDQQQSYMQTGFIYRSTVTGSISFTAEAGHKYLVYVNIAPGPSTDENAGTGYTWVGIVEDETTHRKVAKTDHLPLQIEPIIVSPAM